MKTNTAHEGRCFCGRVTLEVSGEPAAMGYCHCASCREWSAAPVTAFTLWPPAAVTITRGAEHIASYEKTERSIRKWCKLCGGHLFTEHPKFGLIDVYAATIAGFPFDPMLHVNYGETVPHLHDGLPKQHDYPAEMGGTGTIVQE
jgi:hypothetical protein